MRVLALGRLISRELLAQWLPTLVALGGGDVSGSALPLDGVDQCTAQKAKKNFDMFFYHLSRVVSSVPPNTRRVTMICTVHVLVGC